MAWQPPEESFDDTKKSQWSPPEESFDDAKKPEWTPPEESFDDSPTKIEDVDKLKELQSTGQKLTNKQQRILFKADDERTFLDKVSGAAGAFIPAAADIIGQTASGAVELANKAVVQPAAFALSGGYNRLDSEEAKKVFKEREEAIRSLGVGAARDTEETVNAAVRFGMFGSATTDKLLGKSEGERFRAWQDRQTMRQLEAQEAEQNPDRVAALLSQNPLIQGYVEYEAKKMGLSPEEVEKVKQDYIQTMLDQGLTKDQINEKVATLGEFVSPVAIPGGGRLSGAVLKPLSKVTAPVFNKTTDLTARGISKFAGGTEFAANKVLQGTELLQTGARKIGEYAINDADTWIKGTVNTAIMPVVGVAKPVSATARVIKDITKQVDVGGTAGRIGMVERAGQAVDSSDLTKRLFGAQGKGGVARAKLADWAIRQSNALIQSGVNAAALNVAMGLPDIETAEDLGFVSGTGFGIGSLAGSRAIDRVSGLVDPRTTMAEKITNFVTPDPAAYRRDQDADIKRFMAQASPEIQQNIADLSNIETRKTAIDATIANLEKKRDSQINPDDAAFDQAQIDGFLKQKEALSKATPETQAEATRQTALAFIDAYDLAQSTGGVAGLRGVNIAVLNPANADQFFRNLYGDSLTQAETTINLLTGIPSLTETDSTKLTEARQLLQKFQNDVEGAKSTRGFAIQEDNTDPNSPNFVPPHLRRINQQGATAVINADLIKHLSAQGFNVRHTLQHEVQHAVQQFAEVNKMLAPLRGQLFDQKIKNDDGTTEVYQQGIFSDEDLDRYATRYAKLMSPSDDGASFYAQFGGEVEKMRAYIKDEILAETAAATGEYAGGTRAALDDVGRNVMDWLEVKTKSGRLKQLKEALRRNGVIFDNIGATSSVLNSQMSPETLAMMRQYQRGLKDFDGTMTVQQSRESDEPDIPLTKILGSVALQNKYRHADFFEKEQIIKATAPDGSVTEIVVPAGAKIDPFIDVYRTQGGQLVDADGNVVTLGPEITFGSMPDGTKFETDTRIARKSNGSPMILTNREMKARARKRTEIIQTAIDSAKDDGSGVRLSDTGNGNYRGVMSPAQIEAFMLLPNEVVSPNLKRMTKFFNTLMAKNDGTRVVMEYQAALLNGKYKALSPKIRDEVPIGFQLTKDGNFALTTISVSRLYDKMQAWADKKPSNLQPWNGDTGAFWDSVTKYLDNHAKGEKGETGLHPDAYIAGKMKNKINDLFNAYNAETKQSNPERSTLPRARGKDNLDIVIRSRRLDRINNFEESPSQKLPINYGYLTTNYMPAVNPMAAPMTAEEVQNRFDGSVTATRVRRAMATGEIDALESELRQMDDLLPTESLQLVQAEGEMPRIQIVSMFDPENVASLEPEEIVSDIDAETEAELAILDAQDGTVPPQDIAKVLSSKLDQLYADGGRSPIIPALESELKKIYQQLESQAQEQAAATENVVEAPETTEADIMNLPTDLIAQPVGPITQFMPAPIEAPSGERGFQSKLQIEIQRNFKGARATPEQLKAVLDNPQNVKAEEVKWSGVMDEIDRLAQENNGKVPVQELLNYLRDEGQVKFDEVTLGENNNIKNVANPNFAQYQLPGGINYREVVLSMLSMPRKTLQPTDAEVKEYYGLLPRKEDLTGDELNRYNELLGKINASNKEVNKKVYYSTHFPNIPNYVAHMRLNERTDSEGNDGLFVEEFQSDRHQAGRKMGYGLLSPAETYDYYQILNEYGGESNRYYTQQQAEDHVSEHGGSIEKRQGIAKKEVQGIPDAPFRTTWPLALFKRALRDAVDGGKTWIGWTVGETQNERFDLSKQVSEIRYWPDEDGRWGLSVIGMNGQTEEFRNDYMTIQQVEEYVGKDVALRMVDGEGEDIGNNSKSLSGDNLKVGGEGMKGFYDQILPKEIGKYVAKMGGKVEKVEIRTGDELVPEIGGSITNVVNSDGQILTYYDQADPVKRRELAQRWIEFNKFKHPDARLEEDTFKGMPIWRVNITPEMANVVSAGQMQFMPAVSDAEYLDLAKDPKANQKQLQRMADEAVEQLTKIAIGDQTTYWHYGIRTEDNGHQVGEVLDGESVHWDDGDPTEEGLGGLSSTAIGANDNSVKDAWKTHRRGGYPGKFSYILGSDDAASNDRGDIGEIVLINPKVLAVFKDAKKPVTYDDEGNVIPLSQRFQTASPDIRFLPAENTAALMVKLPQWQAARQPEILSERVKAAIKSVELAKEAVKSGEYLNELEQEEWEDYYGKEIVFKSSAAERFEKAKAYSIRGRDVSITYHRNIPNSLRVHQIHITKRADRVVADGRVIFERLNPRTDTPFPFSKYEPSNDIAERLNKLAKAEARLFLAMEEEGGRGDRMAAKESAAQWAIRTKAAEFAAILDARDKNAKNQSRSFIAEVWSAFATNDSVFQYGRTDSKKAQDIADAVSAPGKSVTILELGAKIIFIGKEGSITIHDANTDRPYIYAMYANSQGKESGGGSQLYAGALDWIHNNGKKIKSDSGLTDINSIRRTSNFFASAIRHGTTKHLQPHADQGLKWTTSDTLNTAALAVKEMENAFHAIPSVRRWEYDFQNGRFRDDAGNDLTRERFNSALQLGDPEKSGIGLSTLQRAIITNSAIRSFARGEATGSFLESTRRGVAPVSKFVYMPAENTAALSDLPAPEAQQSVEKPLGMVALPQVKNISPEQSKFISEKPLRKFDSLGNKNATQVNADNMKYPVNPIPDSIALPGRWGLVNAKITGMPKTFKEVSEIIDRQVNRLIRLLNANPEFAKESARFYRDMAESATMITDAAFPSAKGKEKFLFDELVLRFLALGSPRTSVAANASKSSGSVAALIDEFEAGYKIGFGEQSHGAKITYNAWKQGGHFDLSLPGVQDKVRSFYLNSLAELIEMAEAQNDVVSVEELMIRAGKSMRILDPNHSAKLTDVEKKEIQRLLDGKATIDMWDMAAKGWAWPGYIIFINRRNSVKQPFQWSQDDFEKIGTLKDKNWKQILSELKITSPDKLRYQQARALKIDENQDWTLETWNERKSQPFSDSTKFSYYTQGTESGLSPGGGGPLYDAQQSIDGLLADRLNELGLATLFGKAKLKARNSQEILWALEKLDNPIEANNDLSLFGSTFEPFLNEVLKLRTGKDVDPKSRAENVLAAMERAYAAMAQQLIPIEVVSGGTSEEAKRIQDAIKNLQDAGDPDAATTLTLHVADGLGNAINDLAIKHGIKATIENVDVGEGGYTENQQVNVAPNIRVTLRGKPEETFLVLETLSRAMDQDGGNVIRKPTMRELNDSRVNKNLILTIPTSGLDQAQRNKMFLDLAALKDANGDSFLTGFTEVDGGISIGNQFYSGDYEKAVSDNKSSIDNILKNYNQSPSDIDFDKAIIQTFSRGQASTKIEPEKIMVKKKEVLRPSFASDLYDYIKNRMTNIPLAGSRPSFAQKTDFEKNWIDKADTLFSRLKSYPIKNKSGIEKAKLEAPDIASNTKITAALAALKSELETALLRDQISEDVANKLKARYGFKEEKQSKEEE